MKGRVTGFLGIFVAMSFVGTVAQPVLASTPSSTTFADIIGGSKLVVLARIHVRSGGGIRLSIERVLKGRSRPERDYPPLLATPPWDHWSEVVIAFREPTTDDFRAYTIAWHVGRDGNIDPEHYQQYRGLPSTLEAMLRYFGAPATNMSPAPPADMRSPAGGLVRLLLVALASLAGLAIGLCRFGRLRAARLRLLD